MQPKDSVTTGKPEIGADGKIPCDCCDHSGMRKRMGTKEKYLCDKCSGTHRRTPPVGYMPQSEIDKLPVEPDYSPDTTHFYTRQECIAHCVEWRDLANTEMQKDLVTWIKYYLENRNEA